MKARACGAVCIQKNYILFKEEFRYGTHQITWRVNRYRRIRAETGFNPHHFPGADYDRDRWWPWRRNQLRSEPKHGDLHDDPARYWYA